MKNKKWWMGVWAIAGLMVTQLGGRTYAANPDGIDLKITVSIPLSVNIVSLDYVFPAGAKDTQYVSNAIEVVNDSAGLTEDYRIKAANSADWTLKDATPGVNQFNLRALISDANVTPLAAAFDAVGKNTGLASTDADLVNAAFGIGTASGNDVASASSRFLFFRLHTPSEISKGNGVEQVIRVTVTAAEPGTF